MPEPHGRRPGAARPTRLAPLAFATLLAGTGCRGEGSGEPVRVHIPAGASFSQVTDSLAAKEIVAAPPLFKLYARLTGAAGTAKPGTYAFRKGTGWQTVIDALQEGDVLTAKLVIPEGWDLERIAPRVEEITGVPVDSFLAIATDSATLARYDVPGPTLEGYLYPATYTFPIDAPLDTVLRRMIE